MVAINIAETFVTTAKRQGKRTAVVEARTGKKLSFTELNAKSDAYGDFFSKEGLSPGDAVILMVKPSAEFICITLSLFKLGTPIVLIDPGMGYANLLQCIERVQPKFFIGIPKAILFSKLFPKPFRTVEKFFCCGNSFGVFGPNITKHVQSTQKELGVYQPTDTDLAAIIFTTGSTGPPKGVRYEHSVFYAQLMLIREYYGIGDNDIDQPAFPLFALFSAALGACSVIPDMDPTKPAQLNPKKFIDSIKKYHVTYSFGSPAIWNVVSNYCIEQSIALASIRKVLMAGAPVPYELIKRVENILPEEALIFTPYGATEALPIVSIEGSEVAAETWQLSRLGKGTCVGRPLPGIDIKIITISDGPLEKFSEDMVEGNGKIGEIIVRGEVVTRAYQNNPQETALAKIRDGNSLWHRMGDVGYLDDEGRLWFCGRRAHRVITGNKTLFPIPCEAIINEHPDVFRSALVGIHGKDARLGQIPVIVIEPKKGSERNKKALLEEIRTLARESTVTEEVEHFLIHSNFPVDIRHNAKIFREQLAIWAQKQLSSHL